MTELAIDRLRAIPRLGSPALERLRGARVGLVGCGTVGGPIAIHLGLLGINLKLIDPGPVEPSNLAAQLFPAQSVGRAKVTVRAEQLRELGVEGRIETRCSRIEALGLGELAGLDLVITPLDALRPRAHVDGMAQQLSVPLLDVAIDGEGQRLLSRVAVYDSRAGDSAACLCCRWDARKREAVRTENTTSACQSWRLAPEDAAPPTLATSEVAGVAAGIAALQAVRILLGAPGEYANQQWLVDLDEPGRIVRTRSTRSAHCAHLRALGPLVRTSARTLGALLAHAARELGAAPEQLDLHHRSLVNGLRCDTCSGELDLVRCTSAIADSQLQCPRCPSGELGPVELSRSIDGDELRALAGLTWSELGIPGRDVVSIRAGDALAHFELPAEEEN